MDRCEQCGNDVVQGTGVDHELNENEVVVFCSMDHFKAWIDKHMAAQSSQGDKVLRWSNGEEWGEIEHPELGKVMTYWKKGTPCYDTYTAPMVSEDGEIYCDRFCQDEAVWKETIWIGTHEGEEEIAFG